MGFYTQGAEGVINICDIIYLHITYYEMHNFNVPTVNLTKFLRSLQIYLIFIFFTSALLD